MGLFARNLADRVVWITGASSGIGRACALEFARRGCRVALSARRAEELESLAREIGPERAAAFPLDVADREANFRTVAAIAVRFGGLDIAFLNAGICNYIKSREFVAEPFEAQIRVNFLGAVYGVEAALPALRRSSDPQIAGVSSVAAYGGLPRAAAYQASKAALKIFLESLRLDLRREGVAVTVVCPGFVKTPMTDRNDFPMPFIVGPEKAARIVVSGVARRAHEVHFPKLMSLGFKGLALLPGPIYSALAGKLAKR